MATSDYIYSSSAFAEVDFAEHRTGYRAVRHPDIPGEDNSRPWVMVYKGEILRYTDQDLAYSEQWVPLHLREGAS